MKMIILAAAAVPAFANPLSLPRLVARQDFGSCRNQSCEVATVAGSTGATVYPYSTYPTGDTQAGDCCIIRYFPAVKDEIYSKRPNLQAYCEANGGDAPAEPNPPGVSTVTVAKRSEPTPAPERREALAAPIAVQERSLKERATCSPNILIFIKGTLEPSDLGITVGPALADGLNSSLWTTVGVNYDNSFDNDYCLGLPGNINARQVLANQTAACPNSNIAMAGYSQGAMVVRNAIARAPASDVARITNVVTFGDPFIGANIGQYSGPVHVFCMTDDGVCDGQINIGLAHLSYGMDISAAVSILEATQKQA